MTCSRRKLLSRAQRQATILQGAATAFATKGFAGTGMEEVAAASGIIEGNRLPALRIQGRALP